MYFCLEQFELLATLNSLKISELINPVPMEIVLLYTDFNYNIPC
jgi:hypothetical protein